MGGEQKSRLWLITYQYGRLYVDRRQVGVSITGLGRLVT